MGLPIWTKHSDLVRLGPRLKGPRRFCPLCICLPRKKILRPHEQEAVDQREKFILHAAKLFRKKKRLERREKEAKQREEEEKRAAQQGKKRQKNKKGKKGKTNKKVKPSKR